MSAEDLEQIVPTTGEPLEIGGVRCRVRRIKTRELLALLNVVVAGAGYALGEARRMLNDDDADTVDTLLSLLLTAIPNAPDETLMLIRVLVEPVNEKDQPRLTAELMNPDPDVLLDVVVVVVEQERDDLERLMGKVRRYLTAAGPKKTPIPR